MTHVRTLLSHSSKIFTAVFIASLIFTWSTRAQVAEADHQPANKFAAAGAALEDVEPEAAHVVLSETMKVPTTHDLALSATLECSILTYLRTTGGPNQTTETSMTEGKVDMWVTIDGTPVPVQQSDYAGAEAHPSFAGADDGSVTACNREYERTVTDEEENEGSGGNPDGDGIDEERDFIATKTANGFNWFALNVGSNYDRPDVPAGAGNNVILVELWVEYDRTEDSAGVRTCDPTTADEGPTGGTLVPQEDCSDAFVGKRVLIAEPTNASVHEQVEPADTPEQPSDEEPPAPPCTTHPICVGAARQ